MYTSHVKNQSALLHCLSSLDVDAWAQVLLPKLVDQGPAGDVALTCSQLRDLCFGAVQDIDLSSLHNSSDTSAVGDWAHSIPQHFKNVTSVQLHEEPSYHITAFLLPALSK